VDDERWDRVDFGHDNTQVAKGPISWIDIDEWGFFLKLTMIFALFRAVMIMGPEKTLTHT